MFLLTKNNLLTGILIGIGLIVIPLIIMGTTYTTEKQNKFEIHCPNIGGVGFVLNTETGEVWRVSGTTKNRKYLSEKREEE